MKIIDKKNKTRVGATKKVDLSGLKESDPLKRNVEKDLEIEEHSPMDPPDPYNGTKFEDVKVQDMHPFLQELVAEHEKMVPIVDDFEKSLMSFKENGYKLNDEINNGFSVFFRFFDDELLTHNNFEEKELFPLLYDRLIESEEHGEGHNPRTAVDMMEDDHIKFIQLATLTFNMLGLAPRLRDQDSGMFVFDVAFNNGRELIELLRLHIYREDNVLFPLAHQLIKSSEFDGFKKRTCNSKSCGCENH